MARGVAARPLSDEERRAFDQLAVASPGLDVFRSNLDRKSGIVSID